MEVKESPEFSKLGLEEKPLSIECQEMAVISIVLMTSKLGMASLALKMESTSVLVYYFLSNYLCSYICESQKVAVNPAGDGWVTCAYKHVPRGEHLLGFYLCFSSVQWI